MNAMAPVPADHPLMVAWTAYKTTEDFTNSLYWAMTTMRMRQERAEEHGIDPAANVATDEMRQERVVGSLWGAFTAGFNARSPSAGAEQMREACAKVLDDAAEDWDRIRDPGMASHDRTMARKIRAVQLSEAKL